MHLPDILPGDLDEILTSDKKNTLHLAPEIKRMMGMILASVVGVMGVYWGQQTISKHLEQKQPQNNHKPILASYSIPKNSVEHYIADVNEDEEIIPFTKESISYWIHLMETDPDQYTREMTNGWIQYFKDPKHLPEFKKALRNITPVIESQKRIFATAELDSGLAYLAIPESYANCFARSYVNAQGPYQLMPQTAKGFGLRVGEGYNESRDWYLSGQVARDHLKGTEKILKTNAMDANLAAYNSGQPGLLARFVKESQVRIDSHGRLMLVEKGKGMGLEQLNNILERENVERGNPHKKIEGISYNLYCKYMAFQLRSAEEKEKGYSSVVDKKIGTKRHLLAYRYVAENGKYPAKLFATIAIKKELEDLGEYEEEKHPVVTYTLQQENTKLTHIIHKGNTWEFVAKKFGVPLDTLKRANGTHSLRKILRMGDKIYIPSGAKMCVSDVLHACHITLKEFGQYNPAFIAVEKKTGAILRPDLVDRIPLEGRVLNLPAEHVVSWEKYLKHHSFTFTKIDR